MLAHFMRYNGIRAEKTGALACTICALHSTIGGLCGAIIRKVTRRSNIQNNIFRQKFIKLYQGGTKAYNA